MSKKEKMIQLKKIAKLLRYYILSATTQAASGHPTSSLSAVELMAGLFFGDIFRYDIDTPEHPNNDRLVFSKGHASPLLYALWTAAGGLTEEDLSTYRQFRSPLEGHPTPRLPYVEAATGSLGQGLSIGVGLALNAKYLDQLPYRTYVLIGDSEMAEGSQWEAIQIAAHYKLDNLVGILDVNRLGQRGETMYGHDLNAYADRIAAFGWHAIKIDGHRFPDILTAYHQAEKQTDAPTMIIAQTIKGKGVSFVEDKNGLHGKPLTREEFSRAMAELEADGPVDRSIRGRLAAPDNHKAIELFPMMHAKATPYAPDQEVATRDAFGSALTRIYPAFPGIVSLDGEVSNSTRARIFERACDQRFFEMYVAEQNMVGVALGLAQRGKIPFVSSFGAFLTRAFDQIRMSQYSDANIKFVGSHAGVSIGQDGPSQMALEDIAMFRSILDAVVLYPADAVSTERLVEAAAEHRGIVYIRTTRGKTPLIYDPQEIFEIGGSKVLRRSAADIGTIVAAGITLHEALKAYEQLTLDGINVRVVDLYSVQPPDEKILRQAAEETGFILTAEDHYPAGGIGESVGSVLGDVDVPIYNLAVRKRPMSGQPQELLDYEEISANAIIKKISQIVEIQGLIPTSPQPNNFRMV